MVVHLHSTPEQAQILRRTLREHTICFNAVAHVGFTEQCRNGIALHKATYYALRAAYPDLPAQLVCAARVKATEAVKSALTWQKKHAARYPQMVANTLKRGKEPPAFKPVRCPHSLSAPIRYDQRSSWVKWPSLTCNLASVVGRQEIRFTVPKHATPYMGGKVGSADLCERKGRFFLHIVVSIPQPALPPTKDVMGVDLGLNRPAVTSSRHFLGERRWKEQERRLFRLRRKLQATGTTSAKRHLKMLSGQRLRQRKDHDHVLSKRIVQHAPIGIKLRSCDRRKLLKGR